VLRRHGLHSGGWDLAGEQQLRCWGRTRALGSSAVLGRVGKAGAEVAAAPVPRRPLRHATRPCELDSGHHPVLIKQHEQIVRRPTRGADAGDEGPASHGGPSYADMAAPG
jgi:hypothetical protein